MYEECHFQTWTKDVKAARGASSPTEADMAPRSHLRLLLLRLFDDLVARHDLDAGPERRGDAAILRLREFDCRGHGLLRDVVAADDVAHLHARVCARVLLAPNAAHLYAVVGHALALLPKYGDHVNRRAASERDEQQLDRRGGARTLVVRFEHLRVAARRDGDEESVARVVDDGRRFFSVHAGKPPFARKH